ncbi:hypothetical protein TRFO_04538 [Tritrichomonas foetus]|uniref:Uncharacterized protein n=1 Tax=Tritrichomonas foetus TaxID=1144522 RepID=A0A1J4KDF0_9EUKA|nr:hypothetical protein TRFO_04538 [Tritrichomonas foetus]|eukprot:OHT09465.1 hypothetical protein TRFO_04538 [Tritrichomonas foetus]
MQDNLDPRLFQIPIKPIKPSELDLKIDPKQNVLDQINHKIDLLNQYKTQNDIEWNNLMNNSDFKSIVSIKDPLKGPINAGNSISANLSQIASEYDAIEQTMKPLIQIRQIALRSELLKKLKENAIKIRQYISDYEKFKDAQSNNDFLRMHIYYLKLTTSENSRELLHSELKDLIQDKNQDVVNSMKSNLSYELNNAIFLICSESYSILDLFKCLLALKNPNDFVELFLFNTEKLSIRTMKKIEEIFDKFKQKFNVIVGLMQLSQEKIFLNSRALWQMPKLILNDGRIQEFIQKSSKDFSDFSQTFDGLDFYGNLVKYWKKIEPLIIISQVYLIPKLAQKTAFYIHSNMKTFDENLKNWINSLIEISKIHSNTSSQLQNSENSSSYNRNFVLALIEETTKILSYSLILQIPQLEHIINQDNDLNLKRYVDEIVLYNYDIIKRPPLSNDPKPLINSLFYFSRFLHENFTLDKFDNKFVDVIINGFLPLFPFLAIPLLWDEGSVVESIQEPTSLGIRKLTDLMNYFQGLNLNQETSKNILRNYCEIVVDKHRRKRKVYCSDNCVNALFNLYHPSS